MMLGKEKLIEKILSPLPVTCVSFVGFLTYVYVYIKKLAEPDLRVLSIVIIILAVLLMYRKTVRSMFDKGTSFKATNKHTLPTPNEILEKQQRQKDADAKYFGSIIFVLATMYLMFLEVI